MDDAVACDTIEPVDTPSKRAPSLVDFVTKRPRAIIIAICALSIPYLIICVGLALAFANGMSGGCGG